MQRGLTKRSREDELSEGRTAEVLSYMHTWLPVLSCAQHKPPAIPRDRCQLFGGTGRSRTGLCAIHPPPSAVNNI